MRNIAIVIGVVLAFCVTALAQVDSLRLSTINTISVQENIRQYYSVNFQNDNSPELVAVGNSHVYVYSYPEGTSIWISPELSGPHFFPRSQDNFQDMNNDGDIDLVIRDNNCLRVFDIIHSQLIWTSPSLPGNAIFGLGDRNSDGYKDIVFVWREPLRNSDAQDTAWINVYDGPDFNFGGSAFFLVDGSYSSDYNCNEDPVRVNIEPLSGNNGIVSKILIFTSRQSTLYLPEDPFRTSYVLRKNGAIIMVNGANLGITAYRGAGQFISGNLKQIDGSTYYCSISKSVEHYRSMVYGSNSYSQNSMDLRLVSADVVGAPQQVWSYTGFTPSGRQEYEILSLTTGEISQTNSGEEICFTSPDSIFLKSFPGLAPLWSTRFFTYTLEISGIYHSSIHFNEPQIMARYFNPMTYNGSNGLQSAIIIDQNTALNNIFDLDFDGEDEIVVSRSDSGNTIQICHLVANIVGIEDDPNLLPTGFNLFPNYPNPFNASTTIKYSIADNSDVTLKIYDILGRHIATLAEGTQAAGEHSVIWNANDVPSGIYFCRLSVGTESNVRKLVLLK